jgi:peroxiredoxin
MRKNYAVAVCAFSIAMFVNSQASAQDSAQQKRSGNKPKPEDVVRQMADYLAKLPAATCKVVATFEVKAEGQELNQVSKMTVRMQRPNRLALILDEGEMGLTIVSDGKHLTQCLPPLKRYVVLDAPKDYAEMTNIGVPLKFTVLGSTGALIPPTNGDKYFKTLTANVNKPEYVGKEKIGSVQCDHVRFQQERFDWDVWIEEGKRPLPHKVVLDLAKQVGSDKAKVHYTVAFSDWNVAPKFTDADFTFKPPAGTEEVDVLIEEDPPHPLLGKPAPGFKTVDLNEHPFELKSQAGKVVLLDFWATWCGPCVEAMPKVDAVANKFAGRGLVFRAVNGGEDADTIKQFLQTAKLNVPVVLDQDNSIAQAYLVEGIPQTVLIGKDGKVQAVHQGYSDQLPNELASEIEALLADKDLAGEALAKRPKGRKHSDSAAPAANNSSSEKNAE